MAFGSRHAGGAGRPGRWRAIAALGLAGLVVATAAPVAAASDPAPPPAPAVLDATTRDLDTRIGAAERDLIERTDRQVRLTADRAQEASQLAASDARVAELTAEGQRADADVAAATGRIREVARTAYEHQGAGRIVDLMLVASSPREFGFGAEMLERAGDAQRRTLDQARAHRTSIARQLADTTSVQADQQKELADTGAALADDANGIAEAAATLRAASDELAQHLPGVPAPGTTILGTAQLDAAQLLAWYQSTGATPHVTADVRELVDDFLTEGAAEHVRGDIAFVQSMIETGYLAFPGGGLVAGSDNNFAGIGACDSCAHGDRFPDARTGVRAQIQLLHFYADPSMTEARLANPAVRPLDHLGVKGCCPTWYSLSGTWASATTYGSAILTLYQQAVDYGAAHPTPSGP